MRITIGLLTLILLASVGHAGRAATYVGKKDDVTQEATIKRVTSDQIEFRLTIRNEKAKAVDSISGEARQKSMSAPTDKKTSQGTFAAEEYFYDKGKCHIVFRVDMESATMTQVKGTCPEHDRKKTPLNLGATLKLKR